MDPMLNHLQIGMDQFPQVCPTWARSTPLNFSTDRFMLRICGPQNKGEIIWNDKNVIFTTVRERVFYTCMFFLEELVMKLNHISLEDAALILFQMWWKLTYVYSVFILILRIIKLDNNII